MSFIFVKNVYGPPADAICYGCQNDGAGRLWTAVAHTEEYGPIAGKATRTACWYPFGGKEHSTKNFSWLTAPEGKIVPVKNSGQPPRNAVSVGPQRNEPGDCYVAIAFSDYGLIPGKAKGNTCWYCFGGKELYTTEFMWLVSL